MKGTHIISIALDRMEAQSRSARQVFCSKLLGQSVGGRGWTAGGPGRCLVLEKQLGTSVGTLPVPPTRSLSTSSRGVPVGPKAALPV